MKKERLFMLFGLLFLFGISHAAEVTVPAGDTVSKYIEAAADGDVIILKSGATYIENSWLIDKSLTVKAEDGYTKRPLVIAQSSRMIEFTRSPIGQDLKVQGIDFFGADNNYLMHIRRGDSLSSVTLLDVDAHDFIDCVIRASDSKNSEGLWAYVDTLIIDNCHFYDWDGKGRTSRLFYIKNPCQYFKMTNSSIVNYERCALQLNSNTSIKNVEIDKCTFHMDGTDGDDHVIDIKSSAVGSFRISNSIISGINGKGFWSIDTVVNLVDSIYNVHYWDVYDSSATANLWSYENAFAKSDPQYTNPDEGVLFIPAGSPALTASNTGGPIGDPRWLTLPETNSLFNIRLDWVAGYYLLPGFHKDSLNYKVTLPFGVDSIFVNAIPSFTGATVAGDGRFDLTPGTTSTATIVVTPQGGGAAKTYTVDIEALVPSTDAALSALMIRSATDTFDLTPVFDPAVFAYTLQVPTGDTIVYVEADANDGKATVNAPPDVDLKSGKGTATITCTAEDGTTKRTYVVEINVAGMDATLCELIIKVGDNPVTLTPAFDPEVIDYTATLPFGTTEAGVTATACDAAATVDAPSTVDVSSGSAPAFITVTGGDGVTVKEYTVGLTVSITNINLRTIDNIRVFHNPAIDKLMVLNAAEVEQVDIYNIAGSLILSKTASQQDILSIGTETIPNGIYMVRLVMNGNHSKTIKFAK